MRNLNCFHNSRLQFFGCPILCTTLCEEACFTRSVWNPVGVKSSRVIEFCLLSSVARHVFRLESFWRLPVGIVETAQEGSEALIEA